MAKITSKARQLRLDYQAKLGRTVPLQEVAEQIGITRSALNNIELNKNERIDYDTLIKLCRFYSTVLDRTIGVGDVLEYDPDAIRAPSGLAWVS